MHIPLSQTSLITRRKLRQLMSYSSHHQLETLNWRSSNRLRRRRRRMLSGRRVLDRWSSYRFHTTVEEYSLVGWDSMLEVCKLELCTSMVVAHRLDLMVRKHSGCTDLVVSTHMKEERHKFLDPMAMEMDSSHNFPRLVKDRRYSCLET